MKKQLEIKLTTKFKKQLKSIRKQPNFNYNELDKVINMLSSNVPLPDKYKNHLLNPKSKRNLGMSYTTRYIVRISKK